MKHFLKDMLPMALVMILAIMFWFSGYYTGQNDQQAFGASAYELGRNHREAEIAHCSLEDARAERCYIPCSTDSDCLEKNGQTDH